MCFGNGNDVFGAYGFSMTSYCVRGVAMVHLEHMAFLWHPKRVVVLVNELQAKVLLNLPQLDYVFLLPLPIGRDYALV